MTACIKHVDETISDLNQALDSSRESVRASEASNMTAKSTFHNLKLSIDDKERELSRIAADRDAVNKELLANGSGARNSAKVRCQEAEAEYDRANSEMLSYQESANKKISTLKTELIEVSDRLKTLDSLISQDDNALRELSVNRSEMERLNAIERQCANDNDVCLADASALFSQFSKQLSPVSNSINYPASIMSIADAESFNSSLTMHSRELKSSVDSKKILIEEAKRHLYQLTAELESDEKRVNELKNKIAASGYILKSLENNLFKVNDIARRNPGEESHKDLTTDDSSFTIEEALRSINDRLSNFSTFHESSVLWRAKIINKANKSKGSKSNNGGGYLCPCCNRGMDDAEKERFDAKVSALFKFSEADSENSKRELDEFKDLSIKTQDNLRQLQPFAEYKADLKVLEVRIVKQRDLVASARYDVRFVIFVRYCNRKAGVGRK